MESGDDVIDLHGNTALLLAMAIFAVHSPAHRSRHASIFGEYLATHVRQVFKLCTFGFGPTELRVVLSVSAVISPAYPGSISQDMVPICSLMRAELLP